MAADPVPDVCEALAPLVRLLVAAVREEAAKQARGDEGPAYYDARTSPMGRRAFLRLARAKAFPTFKAGKRLVARRQDVHAWIEAQEGARPAGPRPRPKSPEELTTDDIHAAILAGTGVRKRNDGPATRRSP